MSAKNIPPCPASLKHIQHYLKTATEHEERDIVVSYWCRMYALQLGLKADRSSQEARKLFAYLMDWLEKTKTENADNEAIVHDIPAQAHLENYALKLFIWADSQDRTGTHNKNVVKAFYTAALIYDVLDTFGDVSEENLQTKKYAKWKATYIYNCLKNGETPVPGPAGSDENLDEPTSSKTPGSYRGVGQTDDTVSRVSGVSGISDVGGIGGISGGIGFVPSKSVLPASVVSKGLISIASDPDIDIKGTQVKNSIMSTRDVKPENASVSGVQLSPEQMTKAQKYCKWAASALNYDDVPTAVTHLQKALQLLTTGVDE